MLSLRLHANPDKVCYRNCYALSNIRLFVLKQTYVKDMSASPLFVSTATAAASVPPHYLPSLADEQPRFRIRRIVRRPFYLWRFQDNCDKIKRLKQGGVFLERIESKIKYQFKNRDLLKLALTHSSHIGA